MKKRKILTLVILLVLLLIAIIIIAIYIETAGATNVCPANNAIPNDIASENNIYNTSKSNIAIFIFL